MKGTISVLVADPEPVWRLGVQTLLAKHEGLRQVDEAASAGEARRLVGVLAPRVLLLALDLAGARTEALLAGIRSACAGTRVLVVGRPDAGAMLPELLPAGAAGYALRDEPPKALAAALRAVAAGGTPISPRLREVQRMQPRPGGRRCRRLTTPNPRPTPLLVRGRLLSF